MAIWGARWGIMVLIATQNIGCDDECVTTVDCNFGQKCQNGVCKTAENSPADSNLFARDSDVAPDQNRPPERDDTDTQTTDTEEPPPASCDGEDVWYDSTTHLCWYSGFIDLGGVMFAEAPGHCGSLTLGDQTWRLPRIQELFTVFLGCHNDHDCAVSDPSCLTQECQQDCGNDSCPEGEGPTHGCYIKPALLPTDGCGIYWSSSIKQDTQSGEYAWIINSTTGGIQDLDVYFSWGGRVACVFEVNE